MAIHVFWNFISENLRPPLILLQFQVLIKNLSKWRHFFKNTTRVEITITISTAILIKYDKKLSPFIRAIFYIKCHYNFNPCGIFEKMMSFTQILNQDLEQGKLMEAVNSRK